MDNVDYQIIRKEIRLYAKSMNQWWKRLQEDHVAEWTLLATIGCWGIPNRPFQIVSFILTILFFAGKLLKLPHKNSFSKSEHFILKKISEANISIQQRDKLSLRLNKVKKFRQTRNSLFIIRRNWRFISGYVFLMTPFLFNIYPWSK